MLITTTIETASLSKYSSYSVLIFSHSKFIKIFNIIIIIWLWRWRVGKCQWRVERDLCENIGKYWVYEGYIGKYRDIGICVKTLGNIGIRGIYLCESIGKYERYICVKILNIVIWILNIVKDTWDISVWKYWEIGGKSLQRI